MYRFLYNVDDGAYTMFHHLPTKAVEKTALGHCFLCKRQLQEQVYHSGDFIFMQGAQEGALELAQLGQIVNVLEGFGSNQCFQIRKIGRLNDIRNKTSYRDGVCLFL
jgi:hypothetical protein